MASCMVVAARVVKLPACYPCYPALFQLQVDSVNGPLTVRSVVYVL